MSKLYKAPDIDLAERAEQLSKEAERLRSDDKAVPDKVDNGTDGLARAVATSVQRLRKLASAERAGRASGDAAVHGVLACVEAPVPAHERAEDLRRELAQQASMRRSSLTASAAPQ